MKKNLKLKKGFTLIELMVVVAIIALISSIVFASLSTARAKSRDAFLKQEAGQLRILLEQEYGDNKSYANLQPPWVWVSDSAGCTSWAVSGTYAPKAKEICNAIVKQGLKGAPGVLFVGNNASGDGSTQDQNKYSILIGLPGKNTYYCLGSSGQSSDTTSISSPSWSLPGCFNNP